MLRLRMVLRAVLAASTLLPGTAFAGLGITHLEVSPVRVLLDGKPIPHGDDYAFIGDFSEGLALAYRFTREDAIIKQYIDLEGKVVLDNLPTTWREFLPKDIANKWETLKHFAFREGLAVYGDNLSNDDPPLYGYMDPAGKTVIAPAFRQAMQFKDGVAFVILTDGAYGIIDRTGKVLHTLDKTEYVATPPGFPGCSLFITVYNKNCVIPVSWTANAARKKVYATLRYYDDRRNVKEREKTFKIPDFTEVPFQAAETLDPARFTREFGRTLSAQEQAALADVEKLRAAQAADLMKRREQIGARHHMGNPAKPKRFIVGQLYGETTGGSVSVTREVDRGLTYVKTETKTINTSSTRSFMIWRYVDAFEGSTFTLLRRYAPVQTAANRSKIPPFLLGLRGNTIVGAGDAETFLKSKGGTLGNLEETAMSLSEAAILSMTDLPIGGN